MRKFSIYKLAYSLRALQDKFEKLEEKEKEIDDEALRAYIQKRGLLKKINDLKKSKSQYLKEFRKLDFEIACKKNHISEK